METNTCQSSSSFGDIKQWSGVQKLCYQTVDGSVISLDVINHQPSVCQEFIVTSPKFSYCRWMVWTVGFYILGCILQIHLQVTKSVNITEFFILIYAQDYFCTVISARCDIYISRLCYDVSVRLSVHLSVTEVHWRIVANLGFKFQSQFTAICGCGACGRKH